MENKIDEFINLLNSSNNIVFFGGAGVSTESGIPDFRSKDGLYNQRYDYPPEQILSHTFFMKYTEEFYKFYKEKMNVLNYEPNITHQKLVDLEKNGNLKAIITQNIDGLHQKAGSKTVYELHGSIHRNYCMKCNKFYDANYIFTSNSIPTCSCGGIIKPDVVLYEEGLDDSTWFNAISAISKADMLIVAGTSLTVYPASSLINYYLGKKLVLINKDSTQYDSFANLVINDKLGNIFSKI
ncbi:MAG: NAD-dependent protein deacylase [Clostridia bacterium]|nr:NAD-dependent protein deacylase [Clostridia bacterium]